jgi:single-strand DNA-binding protein
MQKNRIELEGFLGGDPQIRYLPSGTKVANASLAEGYRWSSNNEQKEHTNWHKLVFYGVIADVAETFSKGDNIHIDGTLQVREFTPKDGHKRVVHEVVVRSAFVIAPPRNSASEAPSDNNPTAELTPPQMTEDQENGEHENFWHGPS